MAFAATNTFGPGPTAPLLVFTVQLRPEKLKIGPAGAGPPTPGLPARALLNPTVTDDAIKHKVTTTKGAGRQRCTPRGYGN